jgi:hypothetical protein
MIAIFLVVMKNVLHFSNITSSVLAKIGCVICFCLLASAGQSRAFDLQKTTKSGTTSNRFLNTSHFYYLPLFYESLPGYYNLWLDCDLSADITSSDISCHGASDGSITHH